MAQQMKILTTRPHDISWISQIHRFEWEERTLTPKSYPVTSTSIFFGMSVLCPCTCVQAHLHTHTLIDP